MYKIMYKPIVRREHLLIREPENRDASDSRKPLVALAVALGVMVRPVNLADEVVVGEVEVHDAVPWPKRSLCCCR